MDVERAWDELLQATKPGTWAADNPDAPGHWKNARELLSREWIVLYYREPQNTSGETVTAWDAYEAATQVAVTAAEAVEAFSRDSGLKGAFMALPVECWSDSVLVRLSDLGWEAK